MGRVVVGVDDGACSEAAFLWAVATLDNSAATYTLAHVRPEHTQYRVDALYGFKKHWEALEAQRKDASGSILARFRNLAEGAGIRFEMVELEGDARTALCDLCKRNSAVLLVLGHRGDTGPKRLLVGSVGSYCCTNAPCAVMIHRSQVANTIQRRPSSPSAVAPSDF